MIAARWLAMWVVAQVGAPGGLPSGDGVTAPAAPVDQAELAGVAAEVSIVAQNLASARKRALDEALYLAVDGAFVVLVEEMGLDVQALPEALVALRASFRAGARRFVRSYRVLTEETHAGRFRIVVDPVIERNALRKEIARVRRGITAAQGQVGLWVGGTPKAAAALGEALARSGLAVAGIVADIDDVVALRAQMPGAKEAFVALVREEHLSTDFVRGADQQGIECRVHIRIYGPAEEHDRGAFHVTEYGFAGTSETAYVVCTERAMLVAARRLGTALAVRGGPEAESFMYLRVTFDQPSALDRLLVYLARAGAAGRCELRRVTAGAADLRVSTPLSADEMGRVLAQDAGRELSFHGMRAQGGDLFVHIELPDVVPGDVP